MIARPVRSARLPVGDAFVKLLNRGLVSQERGDFPEAERCYHTALAEYPEHPEALSRLGALAMIAKHYSVAVDYLERALSRSPENIANRNNLGNAYLMAYLPERALPHLQYAVKKDPKLFPALCNLGRAYRRLGRAELGLPYIERALRLYPDRDDGKLTLAESLIAIGRMEDAAQIYRPMLDKPGLRAQALIGLSQTRKFQNNDPELDLIEPVLADLPKRSLLRDVLHNAAGKIYNDIGRYDVAFSHYEKAKILAGTQFSLDDYHRKIQSYIKTFNPFFFMERKGFGLKSDVPVFIVGMPRSGTTLIEQILSSHPDVYGAGELIHIQWFASELSPLSAAPTALVDTIKKMTLEQSQGLANKYLDVLRYHGSEARRITDKMPHNFEYLGFIALLFPHARVIHARRNPMDNCVSCFMNRFNGTHGYNTDLRKLGAYYREYTSLMDHWRRVLPLQMLEVDYENVVANAESESRRIIDFVGLQWDPRVLKFYETERTVQTISRWQVRQPVFKSSVNRWRAYEQYLGPLKEALGDLARL